MFQSLSQNLEKNLSNLEGNLRDTLGFLKDDFQKKLDGKISQKDLLADLQNLTKMLETRLENTLENLEKTKQKKSDLKILLDIKEKIFFLANALSLGFFKEFFQPFTNHDSEIDSFGMDSSLIEKIRPIFEFLYYKYWRITTTGLENIPNEGRALLVANHSGAIPFDASMIKCAILNEHPVRKDARFLVEDFTYHMPFVGTFMYRIGGVRACPENAQVLLESGHLVIVFPEGVKGLGKYYNQRYQLQRFGRGGFIRLCIETKSPLIPVAVVGAEEIYPIIYKSYALSKLAGIPYIPITPTFPLLGLLGALPLPSKWMMHFGKPISFDNDTDKKEDEFFIHNKSEEVRNIIQNQVLELLKKRRSVWSL